MSEIILVGVCAALVVWLIKLTLSAGKLKNNDVHGLGNKIGEMSANLEQIDKRLTRLEERFDDLVNNKL